MNHHFNHFLILLPHVLQILQTLVVPARTLMACFRFFGLALSAYFYRSLGQELPLHSQAILQTRHQREIFSSHQAYQSINFLLLDYEQPFLQWWRDHAHHFQQIIRYLLVHPFLLASFFLAKRQGRLTWILLYFVFPEKVINVLLWPSLYWCPLCELSSIARRSLSILLAISSTQLSIRLPCGNS